MDLTHPSNPTRILLDTTRRCQLTCWYCHSSSGPNYRGPTLETDTIPEVFDAAEQMRTFDVTITGGEPTLWPGLIAALENSYRFTFTSLQLITNALAPSRRILRAIESANLSRICVSLDGIGDVHETNRGPGTYARTLRGIRELATATDNITVISVIDATNHQRWPELTRTLAELGVSQHHLAPVCFAGHAMTDYRGLTAQQFAEVAEDAESLSAQLPAGFILRFNDTLVRAPRSRTMSLYQMTETWKGWHVIVRPDGDVRTAVRAWGRSWRADETQGNLHRAPLTTIARPQGATPTPFSRPEELARKFHLNATDPLILADIADVAVQDRHHEHTPGSVHSAPSPDIGVAPDLGIDLTELRNRIRANPSTYRFRAEAGFALLFNTRSHDVHILDHTETASLATELAGVLR
ncbi:radical SAM protein [Nocardia sp. NPDC052112]|uniref:radical SAM protein n=1 Tax=Nocardia sp. NPDC052112 TaxID=3155646 RepID=UPI00344519DF